MPNGTPMTWCVPRTPSMARPSGAVKSPDSSGLSAGELSHGSEHSNRTCPGTCGRRYARIRDGGEAVLAGDEPAVDLDLAAVRHGVDARAASMRPTLNVAGPSSGSMRPAAPRRSGRRAATLPPCGKSR